ncbi:hypothetical protein ARMGADRAFT_1028523 [Armillaria gallica]|uniref:DDE-1 domain-containing protein n=1 Tax=Armillaria gallica TaxID=47427 RepID=A0A2H3DIQ2_ARMGA|nr:hypothetical protein ARMGADRAFT_1028523 [Armillaria gallica]
MPLLHPRQFPMQLSFLGLARPGTRPAMVMHAVGWSPSAAVKVLQCDYPTLFSKLNKGTILKWTAHGKKEWSEKTILNVQNCTVLVGSGCTGILAGYKDIQDAINTALQSLRASGIPLNDYYSSVLGWSPRKATCAAAHLPANAFFRLVYTMKWYNIPPELVVNVDQVGVWILPNNSYTFHKKGAHQVDMVAKDKNTLKTMKEWIIHILIPYYEGVLTSNPDLPEDQKCIIFIDIYPVHMSKDFMGSVYNEHPFIILVFVPGNCTGAFQPADVSLQWVSKHHLKQTLFKFLVEQQQQQVAQGIEPAAVKIAMGLPKLHEASVAGLVELYDFMNGSSGHDVVKKDTELQTEIVNRLGMVYGIDTRTNPTEAEVDLNQEDDADIPISAVVHEDLGISIMDIHFDAVPTVNNIQSEGGRLIPDNVKENILEYDDVGNSWKDIEIGSVNFADDVDGNGNE